MLLVNHFWELTVRANPSVHNITQPGTLLLLLDGLLGFRSVTTPPRPPLPFPNSLITFVPFPVTKVEKGSVGSSVEVMGTQQDKPAVARNKTFRSGILCVRCYASVSELHPQCLCLYVLSIAKKIIFEFTLPRNKRKTSSLVVLDDKSQQSLKWQLTSVYSR